MARAALDLLGDRKRLEAMRDAARQTARRRFCATLVVPQYVRFYEQIMASSSAQAAQS